MARHLTRRNPLAGIHTPRDLVTWERDQVAPEDAARREEEVFQGEIQKPRRDKIHVEIKADNARRLRRAAYYIPHLTMYGIVDMALEAVLPSLEEEFGSDCWPDDDVAPKGGREPQEG